MRDYTKSKIILSIPVLVLVMGVLSGIVATILEKPTGRGFVYSNCAIVSLSTIFLHPMPCIILAIVGIWFAWRAYRKENVRSVGWIILGIAEIIVFGLILALSIMIFDTWRSV